MSEGAGAEPAVSQRELEALEAFAVDTAIAAGRATLPYFRHRTPVDHKPGAARFDPVTAADRDAEAVVRERIRARYPDHGLLGEEHGHEPGTARLAWVIDPIDGTRSFVSGFLHWGLLLALNEDGRPRIGVAHQPWTGELWIGRPGGAEYRRGDERAALAVRPCEALEAATLCTTDPGLFEGEEAHAFAELAARSRLRRYGGDCYAYCMLAAGCVDLVVESGLAPWDVAALVPICEGAGGRITTWRGGSAHEGGRIVAAGDARVHAAALEVLGPVADGSPSP